MNWSAKIKGSTSLSEIYFSYHLISAGLSTDRLYTELKQVTLNATESKVPAPISTETVKGDLHERFQTLSQVED